MTGQWIAQLGFGDTGESSVEVGPFRSKAKAQEVCDRLNRKAPATFEGMEFDWMPTRLMIEARAIEYVKEHYSPEEEEER